MGYYSTYNGTLAVRGEVSDETAGRIGEILKRLQYEYSCTDRDGGGFAITIALDSTWYGWEADTLRLWSELKSIGVNIEGDIERCGEDFGDFEMLTVDADGVFVQSGEVVYGEKVRVTEEEGGAS